MSNNQESRTSARTIMNAASSPTIERDDLLEKVLARLQKEDRLFDYNVPHNIRNTYDDEQLEGYLQQTYAQETFRVQEPQEIKKYIQIGDWVMKKGDYIQKNVKLTKDAEGVVKKILQEEKVQVKFEKYGKHIVPASNLLVIGFQDAWPFGKTLFEKPVEWKDKHSSLPRLVRYTGEEIATVLESIPDRTLGLVAATWNIQCGDLPHIVWENKLGVQQRTSTFEYRIRPYDFWCTYDMFTLLVPNRVNLTAIIKECRGKEHDGI